MTADASAPTKSKTGTPSQTNHHRAKDGPPAKRDEMTLSKTAALKQARRYVGEIIRQSSTSYVFYGPYAEPGGPTTEYRANSYWQARSERTKAVVHTAIELMEVDQGQDLGQEEGANAIGWEIERAISYLGITDAPQVLNHVLKQLRA